jgi:flagellar operon protein
MNYFHYRPVTSQPLIPGEYKNAPKISQGKQSSFAAELQSVMDTSGRLTISKHAMERLEQRGIQINESRWNQIFEKVKEAKKMGVKDSLVLLENAALIVSAKNETVITAMDRKEATTQIFTNINGTIVMD